MRAMLGAAVVALAVSSAGAANAVVDQHTTIACAATLVHFDRGPGNVGTPWIRAPNHAGIFARLWAFDARLQSLATPPRFAVYAGGISPSGINMKLLWFVRNRRVNAGVDLRILGREIGGTRTFRQRFWAIGDPTAQPGSGAEFASIIDVPAAGCWRLNVVASAPFNRPPVRGSVVVRAINP
jgi:hypothetical protein